jgi:hypothetical protein
MPQAKPLYSIIISYICFKDKIVTLNVINIEITIEYK